MSQAAKKAQHDSHDETLSVPKPGKRALFGFGALPSAMDACRRLMGSGMEIHGEMVKAASECSGVALRACSGMSADLMESGNRTLSQMLELSKEAANCRTVGAVIELQQKAAGQAIESCMDATQKLTGHVHECCVEALSPLQEQASKISGTIAKALTPSDQ